MSERVRSVKVYIEVDTNKTTYTLDRDDVELVEVEQLVREFIDGLSGELGGDCGPPVTPASEAPGDAARRIIWGMSP